MALKRRRFTNYLPGDVRPTHPVTGAPADYFWLQDGERLPRWDRRAPTKAEMLASPELCWLGVPDAAKLLGRSKATVREYIARGELPAAGRPYLIRGSDLIAFTKRRPRIAPPVDLEAAL